MNIIERLKTISLFSGIKNNDDMLAKISGIIKKENYKEGSCIIREDEVGDKMYILNKGTVKIEKNTLYKDSFVIDILRDDMNVFFGEIALMDNELRSASVISVTETECFVIKKCDFEKFCSDNPGIGYYIIKEIAKSLSLKFRKINQDNVNLINAIICDENE
jgi:CRP-like cAMP-binding protein